MPINVVKINSADPIKTTGGVYSKGASCIKDIDAESTDRDLTDRDADDPSTLCSTCDEAALASECEFLVESGDTAVVGDDANGSATVECGDIVHFWSSNDSISISVVAGSAIVDLVSTPQGVIDLSLLSPQQISDLMSVLDMEQLTVQQCLDILACLDFTELSAGQITAITQAFDFTQLTGPQLTDLCATIIANCDVGVDLQLVAGSLDLLDGQTDVIGSVPLTDFAEDLISVSSGQSMVLGGDLLLYTPDEVFEDSSPLSGVAPDGAQWGFDTSTGYAYYVNVGNWAIFPTLYSADSTLGANRIVTQAGNDLSFVGTTGSSLNFDFTGPLNHITGSFNLSNYTYDVRTLAAGLTNTYTAGTGSTSSVISDSGGNGSSIVQTATLISFFGTAFGGTMLSMDTVTGKITIPGVLDPTGLALTPVASNPLGSGGLYASTLWVDSGDGSINYGASNITANNYANADLTADETHTHDWGDYTKNEDWNAGGYNRTYTESPEVATIVEGFDQIITTLVDGTNTYTHQQLAQGTVEKLIYANGQNIATFSSGIKYIHTVENLPDESLATLLLEPGDGLAGTARLKYYEDPGGTTCEIGCGRNAAESVEVFIVTRDVFHSAASVGQQLTLVNATTGECEFESKARGEIRRESNSATTTDFGDTTVTFEAGKAQVTIFDTNGLAHNITADHTNDHLEIDVAGDYELTADISFSGGNSKTHAFAFHKNNGATKIGGRVTRKLGASGDVGACSLHTIATLAVDETVELWAQNETDTTSITIEDITMSAVQL